MPRARRTAAARAPHPTDVIVGDRLRARRCELGWTQARLGAALGVAFQQIQKYEGGASRVGASRLLRFADILGVPISFFFGTFAGPEPPAESPDPLACDETDDLADAFAQIDHPALRRSLRQLLAALAARR